MEALKIASLIEALNLVGKVYRNKDGSQPADAVKTILQQLDGAAGMTLGEWIAAQQSKPQSAAKRSKPKAAAKQPAKPKPEKLTPEEALNRLQRADTQAALRDTMANVTLAAAEWKALAKRLTGRMESSTKAAQDAVETYLSDRLLLNERIESVKRQFNPATRPPAAAS